MVRQTVAVKRGGYRLTITIPVEWWSGTDTIQTEKTRALRRARIRRYAKDKWRNLKTMRQAWKVERFLAVVTVSSPHGGSVFPARAAETVKPIIDAGSDVRLWDDDDSLHRHSTIYLQSPIEAPSGCYLLDILIIPISDENPQYQITGGLAASVVGMWRNVPMDERPAWCDGYEVRFSIPDRIWITSNYTDSDLQARQQGRRKADTWGRDDACRREGEGRIAARLLRGGVLATPTLLRIRQIRRHSQRRLPVWRGSSRPGQCRRNRERDSESGNERRRMAWSHVGLLQGRGLRPFEESEPWRTASGQAARVPRARRVPNAGRDSGFSGRKLG